MASDNHSESELIILDDTVELPYRADTGPILGAFFRELKDNKKIWANKCPQCGRMHIPPESYCGRCWGVKRGDDDWVEMGDVGTLVGFTVYHYEFIHPFTGKPVPVPWAAGLFELDGGWKIQHFIEPADEKAHQLGDRYKAVWKEQGRTGHYTDIICFRKVEEEAAGSKPPAGESPIPQPPAEPHFHMVNFNVTYHHSAGKVGSKFFVTLRDNKKIMGTRCGKCNKVYMPPESVCGECFSDMDEWVELSGKGTLTSYTVVYHGEASQPAPVPHALGIIQLDGADTGFAHLLGEVDFDHIEIGMRMEPVFKARPVGNMLDIKYFRPVK